MAESRQPLATAEEVAAFLQKPVQTLYQWRWRGTGPKSSKVGNQLRYRWSDVDDWLEDQAKANA